MQKYQLLAACLYWKRNLRARNAFAISEISMVYLIKLKAYIYMHKFWMFSPEID